MHILAYTVKLKNYIKEQLGDDNFLFRVLQAMYRNFVFPLERSSWKKKEFAGFESESSLHMCALFPKKTLDVVLKSFNPKTWLDVGCGIGSSLKYIQKQGITVTGLENSDLAIKVSKLGNIIIKHDLTIPVFLNRRFDIIWCYEVAEHLPEEAADILINSLVEHGDVIVFSAAVPGQGGEGHINEQPHTYWIGKMKKHGFIIDEKITQHIQGLNEIYSSNVYCFIKQKLKSYSLNV